MAKSFFEFCMEHNDVTLLKQWDEKANGNLTPHNVSFNSHKKIWWRCAEGHSWESRVYDRNPGKLGCPYCIGRFPIPGETDLASSHPELALQWDLEKNGSFKPSQVSRGSKKKAWWLCEKGHSWYAIIKSRVQGNGCPFCTNRKILPGFNDLATTNPELSLQWDYTKNRDLTPNNVFAGSTQSVWWLCEKGHSWRANIASRVNGNGCPVCSGKKIIPGENDLETAFPEIASQWHPTKNTPLAANMVSPYSNKAVWWLCEKGHEYRTATSVRTTRNSGCPYCTNRKVLSGFNDLATTHPELAAQWHPTLNGELTPQMVTCGSTKKVWWLCPDGHVWKTVVYSRGGISKSGCPVCAGKAKPNKIASKYE